MKVLIGVYGLLMLIGGAPLIVLQMKRLGLDKENKNNKNNKRIRLLRLLWFVWGNAMVFGGFLAIVVLFNNNKYIFKIISLMPRWNATLEIHIRLHYPL